MWHTIPKDKAEQKKMIEAFNNSLNMMTNTKAENPGTHGNNNSNAVIIDEVDEDEDVFGAPEEKKSEIDITDEMESFIEFYFDEKKFKKDEKNHIDRIQRVCRYLNLSGGDDYSGYTHEEFRSRFEKLWRTLSYNMLKQENKKELNFAEETELEHLEQEIWRNKKELDDANRKYEKMLSEWNATEAENNRLATLLNRDAFENKQDTEQIKQYKNEFLGVANRAEQASVLLKVYKDKYKVRKKEIDKETGEFINLSLSTQKRLLDHQTKLNAELEKDLNEHKKEIADFKELEKKFLENLNNQKSISLYTDVNHVFNEYSALQEEQNALDNSTKELIKSFRKDLNSYQTEAENLKHGKDEYINHARKTQQEKEGELDDYLIKEYTDALGTISENIDRWKTALRQAEYISKPQRIFDTCLKEIDDIAKRQKYPKIAEKVIKEYNENIAAFEKTVNHELEVGDLETKFDEIQKQKSELYKKQKKLDANRQKLATMNEDESKKLLSDQKEINEALKKLQDKQKKFNEKSKEFTQTTLKKIADETKRLNDERSKLKVAFDQESIDQIHKEKQEKIQKLQKLNENLENDLNTLILNQLKEYDNSKYQAQIDEITKKSQTQMSALSELIENYDSSVGNEKKDFIDKVTRSQKGNEEALKNQLNKGGVEERLEAGSQEAYEKAKSDLEQNYQEYTMLLEKNSALLEFDENAESKLDEYNKFINTEINAFDNKEITYEKIDKKLIEDFEQEWKKLDQTLQKCKTRTETANDKMQAALEETEKSKEELLNEQKELDEKTKDYEKLSIDERVGLITKYNNLNGKWNNLKINQNNEALGLKAQYSNIDNVLKKAQQSLKDKSINPEFEFPEEYKNVVKEHRKERSELLEKINTKNKEMQAYFMDLLEKQAKQQVADANEKNKVFTSLWEVFDVSNDLLVDKHWYRDKIAPQEFINVNTAMKAYLDDYCNSEKAKAAYGACQAYVTAYMTKDSGIKAGSKKDNTRHQSVVRMLELMKEVPEIKKLKNNRELNVNKTEEEIPHKIEKIEEEEPNIIVPEEQKKEQINAKHPGDRQKKELINVNQLKDEAKKESVAKKKTEKDDRGVAVIDIGDLKSSLATASSPLSNTGIANQQKAYSDLYARIAKKKTQKAKKMQKNKASKTKNTANKGQKTK